MVYNKIVNLKERSLRMITIALYDNKTYIANYFKNQVLLFTSDQEKTDNSFRQFEKGFKYAKCTNLADNKLISLYNLDLKANYNSGLLNTPKTWEIVDFKPDVIKNKQLKLVYKHGVLPNWTKLDNGQSYKYVDFDQIGQCYAEYTYFKKNGAEFSDGLMHVFAKISIEELNQIFDYVRSLF